MNFKIKIKNKEASTVAGCIVCGNSDYTITFVFDSEWAGLQYKTARFVYAEGDKIRHQDVGFSGNTVEVPVFRNITEVFVGVFSGEICTTTPARIVCKKSILCGDTSIPEPPSPDVYAQIVELINTKISGVSELPAVSAEDKGDILAVDETGVWNKKTHKELGLVKEEELAEALAEYSDEWEFELEDGTTVTKKVVVFP